jgi:hypothetical protein
LRARSRASERIPDRDATRAATATAMTHLVFAAAFLPARDRVRGDADGDRRAFSAVRARRRERTIAAKTRDDGRGGGERVVARAPRRERGVARRDASDVPGAPRKRPRARRRRHYEK